MAWGRRNNALTLREVSISCGPTRTHVMPRCAVLDHTALEQAATCVQMPRARRGCGWCNDFAPDERPSRDGQQPVRGCVTWSQNICASRV
jgi:hypothetical protein